MEEEEKEIKRLDKNLKIAVTIIIILIVIGSTYFIAKPKYDNFISQKQVEAAQQTVAVIVDAIKTNGYVQIGEGVNAITLIEYKE